MHRLQFASFNEYRSFLKDGGTAWSDDRIAVMAGHFMLGYEPNQARLEPLIFQDAGTTEFRHFSKLMANDFPLSTFQDGLAILADLTPLAKQIKIFLLVNDHKFTDPVFQPAYYSIVADQAGELRKDYFARQEIPRCFSEELGARSLSICDVILDSEDHQRPPESILPKRSPLFSEMALRNRFNRRSRKLLQNSKRFELVRALSDVSSDAGHYNIYYRSLSGGRCSLTEEGTCGCTGEMVELFLHLAESGHRRVVALTPDECRNAVNEAAIVGVELARDVFGLELELHIVTGLGGLIRPGRRDDSGIEVQVHA